QFLDEGLSAREFFEITRRAATRPKSEKPRRSREGKRGKRLKRQQQERKEKYRKRQCRANHEQQHQLSKLRATHDVQHQRSGARNFSRWGLPHAPNPTPRKGVTAIVLRIRLGRYCGISSKNNSACPILLGFPLYRWRIRVLTLDPMPRAAGDIGEAEPLLISCFRGPPLVSVIDPSVNLILYPLPQPRSSTAGAIFGQGDRCRGKLGQRLHLGSYALALSCRGSSHGCRPDESRGSPDDHAAHCYP